MGGNEKGFSFLELLITALVLMVLASTAVPLARWDQKRRMENRLRVSLEHIRGAIDQYNRYAAEGLIVLSDVEQCGHNADLSTCYPTSLDELMEGVEVGDPQSINAQTITFLRVIPVDPFTGLAEWGLRSYQDDWDSRSWGGENVYDVYSLSDMQALDGTLYENW